MISAIFSPILVQIITTRAQMQKEKREYSERHKQEVIENYLKEMGKHIYSGCKKGNSDYGACLSEIYMYFPHEYWYKITEVIKCVREVENMSANSDQSINARNQALSRLQDMYLDLCKEAAPLSRDKKLSRNHIRQIKQKSYIDRYID